MGGTDAEAEASIISPPDAKNWLIWRDPDAWRDWGQEEKEMTEDGWMASPTRWTGVLSELRELVIDREAWHAAVQGVSTEWQSWTELKT